MADSSHFFQPLLPNFQSYLNIPKKFFSKHIEGKHKDKTVTLRSDASEKTWKVKLEGQRLTNGWREFVEAHDLRVGDFVVFRKEQDLLFHVTVLGPSCCEIQYASFSNPNEKEEESDEIEQSSRFEKKKEVEKNLKGKSNQPLLDLTCFSRFVTASNLSRDTVDVPTSFGKRNGLKGSQEIVLMNEEGRSWPSKLKTYVPYRVTIIEGWRSFCIANKLQVGDSCTFKLLPNAKTPVFQLCIRGETEQKKRTLSPENNIAENTTENRFVKLTPTLNSLEVGKQHLPASFTRANEFIKPGKIVFVDENGAEWFMELKVDRSKGLMYIKGGNSWKCFCSANKVGAGESLTLELIRGGASPVLKFCTKNPQMELESLEPEARSHKRARFQKRSHEKRPKQEPSDETRPSNKSCATEGNLRHTQPCDVSNHVAKVKQSVVDTLSCIRQSSDELEILEQRLEDSLQGMNDLEKRTQWI